MVNYYTRSIEVTNPFICWNSATTEVREKLINAIEGLELKKGDLVKFEASENSELIARNPLNGLMIWNGFRLVDVDYTPEKELFLQSSFSGMDPTQWQELKMEHPINLFRANKKHVKVLCKADYLLTAEGELYHCYHVTYAKKPMRFYCIPLFEELDDKILLRSMYDGTQLIPASFTIESVESTMISQDVIETIMDGIVKQDLYTRMYNIEGMEDKEFQINVLRTALLDENIDAIKAIFMFYRISEKIKELIISWVNVLREDYSLLDTRFDEILEFLQRVRPITNC